MTSWCKQSVPSSTYTARRKKFTPTIPCKNGDNCWHHKHGRCTFLHPDPSDGSSQSRRVDSQQIVSTVSFDKKFYNVRAAAPKGEPFHDFRAPVEKEEDGPTRVQIQEFVDSKGRKIPGKLKFDEQKMANSLDETYYPVGMNAFIMIYLLIFGFRKIEESKVPDVSSRQRDLHSLFYDCMTEEIENLKNPTPEQNAKVSELNDTFIQTVIEMFE